MTSRAPKAVSTSAFPEVSGVAADLGRLEDRGASACSMDSAFWTGSSVVWAVERLVSALDSHGLWMRSTLGGANLHLTSSQHGNPTFIPSFNSLPSLAVVMSVRVGKGCTSLLTFHVGTAGCNPDFVLDSALLYWCVSVHLSQAKRFLYVLGQLTIDSFLQLLGIVHIVLQLGNIIHRDGGWLCRGELGRGATVSGCLCK